ncbi:MAG: GMC oxidoreductase, partial [Proteobacteria bacterium]|nr:GMC oxidoreductase [Pseudomonadota bacterium]
EDVLPYFRKLETDTDFDGDMHGSDGPVPIRRLTPDGLPPMANALFEYCRNQQITEISDLNGDFREGIGVLPLSRFPDKRASSAICYLDAATRQRPNLDLMTDATVLGIDFQKPNGTPRATGVRVEADGETRTITGGEIIISAGALQSPGMLLRAGIGPAQDLQALGVELRADRPGVGANLHNHHLLLLVAHLRRHAVPAKHIRAHTATSVRYTSNVPDCPPMDMYIPFGGMTGWHALGRRISSLTPTVAKPLSRGRVSLTNTDPRSMPSVEFDYHSDDLDRVRHVDAVRRAAGMLLSPELRPLWHTAFPIARAARMRQLNDITTANRIRARAVSMLLDILPAASRPVVGSLSMPGVDVTTLAQDDDVLDEFVRTSVSGPAHHVGTCRMGAADDPNAVVDPQARVYGVDGLRVVDASIMPSVPRGNTNIPTIMTAEKISQTILDGS